jgi:hypothetical protein
LDLADLPFEVLDDIEVAQNANGPLLLLYPSPDLALDIAMASSAQDGLQAHYRRVAELASRLSLEPSPPPCRLVNLALSALPGVIRWAVRVLMTGDGAAAAATSGSTDEPDLWFRPQPEPIDALITLELLRLDPTVESAYVNLENHPLAAAADGRQPDLAYAHRLRQAASLDRILQARQSSAGLEQQLRSLGAELGTAHADLIDSGWIREQLGEQLHAWREQVCDLEGRLEEQEAVKRALQAEIREAQQALQHQQNRYAELQANQAEIQASLEQAVRCSRSQRDLHGAMQEVLRSLQSEIARLQRG